jgi:hypothetical protein
MNPWAGLQTAPSSTPKNKKHHDQNCFIQRKLCQSPSAKASGMVKEYKS